MTQPTLTITRHTTATGGEYRATLQGHNATALLTWRDRPGNIRVADHTLVPSAIGGRGIAARLVERLVADARAQGAKIVPACSYVAVAFDRHPEWADLLA